MWGMGRMWAENEGIKEKNEKGRKQKMQNRVTAHRRRFSGKCLLDPCPSFYSTDTSTHAYTYILTYTHTTIVDPLRQRHNIVALCAKMTTSTSTTKKKNTPTVGTARQGKDADKADVRNNRRELKGRG